MRILHHSDTTELVWDRQAAVVERCRGQRVLHLGCVDHGYETRLEEGTLLHQKLDGVCHGLWGVDIEATGIAAMRDAGFDNLVAGNVEALDRLEDIAGQAFDVIVAAELMEHLSAPGTFLDSARELIGDNATRLLITVPSAYRLDSMVYALRGHEVVHPDHAYWFSMQTLRALLERHGFRVVRSGVYATRAPLIVPDGDSHRLGARWKSVCFRTLKHALVSRAHLLADGLIVEAEVAR